MTKSDDREETICAGVEKLKEWPRGMVGYDQEYVAHSPSRGTLSTLQLYQDQDGSIRQVVPAGINEREAYTIIPLSEAKEMMNELHYEDLVRNIRKMAPPTKLPTREQPVWMKNRQVIKECP